VEYWLEDLIAGVKAMPTTKEKKMRLKIRSVDANGRGGMWTETVAVSRSRRPTNGQRT
jgi:hypothetical protein